MREQKKIMDMIYTEQQKLGSEVTGLNNVIINASNDINIKGSTVASDGTASAGTTSFPERQRYKPTYTFMFLREHNATASNIS